MSTTEIRRKHRCAPGFPDQRGVVVECECGRIWITYLPGNPAWAGWRRRPRWWAHLRGWMR